jgi:hypothetical protein
MQPRTRAALILVCAALSSCSAAPPRPSPPAPAPAPSGAPAAAVPVRYLVTSSSTLEHTDEGLDRVVVSGRRLELRGIEIATVGPAEPEVDGGARAPSWAAGSAARYVFWKDKQLWGAETFMGPLHLVATLPAAPGQPFDWLDGAALVLPGGVISVPASGGAPARVGVPAVTRGLAADARRGLAFTALGGAWLTLDGGASYRDVTADLGSAFALEARGDHVLAHLPGDEDRIISASGAVSDGGTRRSAPPPAHPPPDRDPFEVASGTRPADAAARTGVPLPDGGVVITARGYAARFDPATLRTTSLVELDPGLARAECTPLRLAPSGEVLLVCIGPDRATVVDLSGTARTERTFDLAGASELDRFVIGGDDALGYLGACDGTPPRVPEVETFASGEQRNSSRQRVAVFCVRAGRDAWVEHHIDRADEADVAGWIPRAGGGAVALVLRPGLFLDERERVSVRGGLRTVRFARTEPPLNFSPYTFDRGGPGVDRSRRVLADDSIEGWLAAGGYGASLLSVTIDPRGHAVVHAAPARTQQIIQAGRFALAVAEDGGISETVDRGHRWVAIEPPPGTRHDWSARPSVCSPAGCVFNSFVRLGWASEGVTDPPAPPHDDTPREPPLYTRTLPPPPVLRLSCAPAGPPESRRTPDSGGFGYTPQPLPRNNALTRIVPVGAAVVPWSNTPLMPATGDADVAWITPLDVTGTVHRVTVPLSRLGLSGRRYRTYEVRTGYLLAEDGGLELFATGWREQCLASLLDLAGVTRPLGACADEPSVGVDLGGGRVVVIHPPYELGISVAEAPPRRGSGGRRDPAPGGFSIPVALHEIHRTATSSGGRGFTFGAGARAGAPVVVVVDGAGRAALAPVDPSLGTIGAEERLRPLTEAALGSSPGCAPRPGEARVVLPFDGLIGIDQARLRGVGPAQAPGVAVLRWSADRACLDAVEIPVHDDRFDESPGPYEPHGTLRKIVARLDRKDQAVLLLVGLGSEVRQRLSCTALAPGNGEP